MGVRLHNQDFGQLNVGRVTVTDFSFPKTQSGLAFERIRAMILDWSLQPGATIDEKTLGASLGMGRTPIREA
ncbi:MAG: GntR family transcriptional regulator, partial [Pseudomonadota bacterium]